MRKALLVLVLLSLVFTMTGCAQIGELIHPSAPSATRPQITVSPAPSLDVEPAALYTGVETDQRVVSLIFEGFTDSTTMNQLIDELSARKMDCVFFFSGLTATEETDTVRRAVEAGFTIGNYGITGEKDLQDVTIDENIHQFTRGQELLAQTCGVTPTLFRCNGTEYTREVLQAAAASGLTAGIEPTVYLNHHSFASGGDASTYIQRLVRGSIISVKLGQELDAVEYGTVTDTNGERPAIDPSPSISDEADQMLLVPYQDIVSGVSWLLDALEEAGYKVVAPDKLSQYAVNLLGDAAELSEETLALLDASAYLNPVTTEALVSSMTKLSGDAVMTDCVLVGDSVANSVAGYVQWRRQTEPDYLAGLQFLIGDRLTVESALMKVSATSYHPEHDGVKGTVEDTLRLMNAKRVYLMLQCSDPRLYSGDYELANYKLLIYLIRKQNPGIEICVLAVPPHVSMASETLTNTQVFRFNLALLKLCMRYGIPFLDASFDLRGADGSLREQLCIDPDTYGTHLNDAGCERLLAVLAAYAPTESAIQEAKKEELEIGTTQEATAE